MREIFTPTMVELPSTETPKYNSSEVIETTGEKDFSDYLETEPAREFIKSTGTDIKELKEIHKQEPELVKSIMNSVKLLGSRAVLLTLLALGACDKLPTGVAIDLSQKEGLSDKQIEEEGKVDYPSVYKFPDEAVVFLEKIPKNDEPPEALIEEIPTIPQAGGYYSADVADGDYNAVYGDEIQKVRVADHVIYKAYTIKVTIKEGKQESYPQNSK